MKNTKAALNKGFSLVEMLVVIAVIGIIAAIAVPQIGRINESAKDATERRNAQNIASVYASAQASGHDFATGLTLADGDTGDAKLKALIGKVKSGFKITDEGPFKNAFFGVPNLSPDDIAGAADYLQWSANSGSLIYTGSPQN